MNLTLMMTRTTTAAAPETTATADIALVIYPGQKAHPPDNSGTWRQITDFTPDPTATYTVTVEGDKPWPVHAEGIAVFRKET
jgi:hypothetical protein